MAAAVVVAAMSWMLVDRPDVSPSEVQAFRVVNDAPAWLWPVLWPVMQLGNLAAPAAAAGAAAVALRRWRPVWAALAAGYGGWAVANVVKDLVVRQRPDMLLPHVIMREGAEGLGFVSGHAAVATAVATVLWPYLAVRGRVVVLVAVVLVGVGRVYAGAHLPLDVVGGTAIGALVGLAINALVGVPAERLPDLIEPDAGTPGRR